MLNSLTLKEREEFSEVVNKLLFKKNVLERVYDANRKELIANTDYRFVNIHKDIISEYISCIGWDLMDDRNNGVFYIENEMMNYHISLSKFTTIIILILRILYDKKQEQLSLDNFISFNLEELLGEGMILGVIETKPTKVELQKCFTVLKKFNVVGKMYGNYSDAKATFVLYPTILHIVNSQNTFKMLKEFSSQDEDKKYKEAIGLLDDNKCELIEDEDLNMYENIDGDNDDDSDEDSSDVRGV